MPTTEDEIADAVADAIDPDDPEAEEKAEALAAILLHASGDGEGQEDDED